MYKLCRGTDDRVLKPDQARQSVSCDVNYGIRLQETSEVEELFQNVSNEVASKLENARLRGKQVMSPIQLLVEKSALDS